MMAEISDLRSIVQRHMKVQSDEIYESLIEFVNISAAIEFRVLKVSKSDGACALNSPIPLRPLPTTFRSASLGI